KPIRVQSRLAAMPPPSGAKPRAASSTGPGPIATPQSCNRPMAQPLKTSGRVSQLGTLNFQPSMTAAVIMPAHKSTTGAGAQTKWASHAARVKPAAMTGTRAICRTKAASISESLATSAGGTARCGALSAVVDTETSGYTGDGMGAKGQTSQGPGIRG